jgi:ligand-binding sensor domain-containing protein
VIYTPDNSGLASPIIYSIGVDNNGIIWSGTAYNGLFRFDGTNWSSHHDPQGYTQGVGAIVFDATGLMWLSIYQPYGMGAVASYNGTDWNVYSYADIGLDMFFVNTIAFESNGNMWIGTNSGMARFNGQIWTTYLTTTSELLNNYVGYICIDENNVKWIGTGGSGIQTLDNNIWNSIDISDTSLPCNQISSLKVDTQDRLIFATQHGLCAFNGANWTGFEDNPYNVYNAIVSVATDSNNNIWFSYANGIIGNFNGSAYTYQDVNDIILDFNTLYAITVDQQNRLWVGTNNCIMEYNPPGWTIYAGANGYPGGHPRYMCFDNLGNLLLGTETNGLIKHYGNYWASYNNTNSSLPYNSIHSLFVDSVGNAWMGCFLDNTSNCTTAALVKFDGYTFTIYHQVPNGIPCDKINAITQDNNGVMWFGSAEGLIKYAFGQWTLFHLDNSGILNNDKITTMACDSQNNIWMGTEQSGVLVFDGAYVSNDEQVLNLDNIFKIAPNPIKDNTNISFDLAKSGKTDISIYNLKGQKVTTLANATLGKGKHNYIWNLKDANGNKVCSGVYLIKMTNDGKSRTSKCLVLK